MQTLTTKKPTAEATQTAIRNAAKMEGYTVKQSEAVTENWFVIKESGKEWYIVNTLRGTCDCPYFRQEGVCKHQEYLREELRIRDMEQAFEDYRDMIASRD